MKAWFTSPNGTVTLSALTLLAFIGYVFMEMRYFLSKWIPGDTAVAVEMFIVLLIVGGWMRALNAATNGKRAGLTALLAFSMVTALVVTYDFQFIPMPWPEQTMVIATFVFSLIAVAALVMQLRQTK